MKKINGLQNLLGVGTALLVVGGPIPALAQDIESRILELEQELILMRTQLTAQVQTAQNAAADSGKSGDKYKMSGPTPKWESSDGRYKMEIDGRIHYDFGMFDQDDNTTGNVEFPDLSSGSNFRRGRIGLKGTVDKEWAYNITFDLGESSDSGNVDTDVVYLQYKGIKPLTFTLGKHKVPNMMVILTSSNEIAFIERGQVANIMTTTVYNGNAGAAATEVGEKRIGFSVGGGGKKWHARTGFFTGSEDYNSGDAPLSIHGRASFAPINTKEQVLHVGVSGWHLFESPQDSDQRQTFKLRDRPEFRVDGNRLIDTSDVGIDVGDAGNLDDANMIGIELAGKAGPAWMMAEWARSEWNLTGENGGTFTGTPDFDGWYISGGLFLTGESRKYSAKSGTWKGVKVKNPFSQKRGTGAWEALARYSTMDLNDAEAGIEGGEQTNYTLGLRWWVNNYVNFAFNYINADVDKDTSSTSGVQEGQDLNIYAFRSTVKW